MSVDYFVAVHAPDWPTPATLNRCLTELRYPVRIADVPDAAQNRPLAPMPNTLGLVVTLDGQRIELEASITKLSPSTPYAFGPPSDVPNRKIAGCGVVARSDLPKLEIVGPDGKKVIATEMSPNAFVPKDLNADLRKLGKTMPFYKNGDYVITLSFGSTQFEWQAGEFLMAALIKCNNGFGFEFQGPSFGKSNFADDLIRDAMSTRRSK